jgi:hypothetical protein
MALLTAALLRAGPVAAQDRGENVYVFSNFDVTVNVQPDGRYAVDESIAYDFRRGTFSRAYRTAVQEEGVLRSVRVTSPDTPVDSVRSEAEDGPPQVRWGFPERTAPARFEVSYVLDRAMYERGGRNVVRLEVLADEAVVPTADVDVRVALPAAFGLREDQLTLEPAGTVARESGRLVATFRRDRVAEGDDYAVEVSFPKRVDGAFLPTGAQIVFGLVLMLLGGAAGGVAAWRWRGPRPDVTARRPPSDLDLPTAVALLQNPHGQAFLGVVLDLARRGHVSLRHDDDPPLGSEPVVRGDVDADPASLSALEQRLVDDLREHETLDDVWANTSSFWSDEISERRDALHDRGWVRSHVVRSTLLFGGSVAAALGGVVAIATGDSALHFYLLFSGIGGSLGSFIAATRRHTWTPAGARRAMALRSYLNHEKAEVERLHQTDPARAAERLVDGLPWLLLHPQVSASWMEEMTSALDAADAPPDLPDGFVNLVADGEGAGASTAALLPVVAVVGTIESSPAAGVAGAGAGTAGAGGTGAAGAA